MDHPLVSTWETQGGAQRAHVSPFQIMLQKQGWDGTPSFVSPVDPLKDVHEGAGGGISAGFVLSQSSFLLRSRDSTVTELKCHSSPSPVAPVGWPDCRSWSLNAQV